MRNSDNTRLVVYTLQNCIYCKVLKSKLTEENINYIEITIDDGNIGHSMTGDKLEELYKTESYPIIILKNNEYNVFISKTDLVPRKGIIIFETIEELIIKIKEKLNEV
jgi:glutaredoxin